MYCVTILKFSPFTGATLRRVLGLVQREFGQVNEEGTGVRPPMQSEEEARQKRAGFEIGKRLVESLIVKTPMFLKIWSTFRVNRKL